MANVLFTRKNASEIPNVPITDGQLIFDTSGNGKMYLDNGTERLVMGGALTVDTTLSKTSTNPIQNKGVAGVMLDNLEDISNVTSKGFLTDALATKKLNESLTNEDGETFNFGKKDGVRGFFTDPSRADGSFVPFSSKPNMIILSSPTSKTYEIVSDHPLNYVISSNYYSTGWMSSNVSPDGVERWMSIADTWKTTQYSNTYPIVSDDKKTITVRGIITDDGQPNTIIVYG